ncbi:hypothetical protein [Micromonospora sp. NPDC050276]|uniref:hypothetical protein n=1 Tax=Micromonospora sp. NPDC050276 TaxID=3364278 RepID=UPI0037AE9930
MSRAIGWTSRPCRTDQPPAVPSPAARSVAALPTAPVVLNSTDDAFVQLLIPMNEGALH